MKPVALGLALVAVLGCGKKKEKPQAAPEEPAPAAATTPDLPAELALDCGRLVPESVRAAHLAGLVAEQKIEGSTVSCRFTGGAAEPVVAFFCTGRARNWDFTSELARDRSKQPIAGLGRAAYSRADGVFFYPTRLDCLVRVVWPADTARGVAISRALDPHLSRASVARP
jgi:hypothetical protein